MREGARRRSSCSAGGGKDHLQASPARSSVAPGPAHAGTVRSWRPCPKSEEIPVQDGARQGGRLRGRAAVSAGGLAGDDARPGTREQHEQGKRDSRGDSGCRLDQRIAGRRILDSVYRLPIGQAHGSVGGAGLRDGAESGGLQVRVGHGECGHQTRRRQLHRLPLYGSGLVGPGGPPAFRGLGRAEPTQYSGWAGLPGCAHGGRGIPRSGPEPALHGLDAGETQQDHRPLDLEQRGRRRRGAGVVDQRHELQLRPRVAGQPLEGALPMVRSVSKDRDPRRGCRGNGTGVRRGRRDDA